MNINDLQQAITFSLFFWMSNGEDIETKSDH